VPDRPDPVISEPSGYQRRDRECERNGERREATEQQRWMNHHARITQQRVQSHAFSWNIRSNGEWDW
jgi:hypothetical protein